MKGEGQATSGRPAEASSSRDNVVQITLNQDLQEWN